MFKRFVRSLAVLLAPFALLSPVAMSAALPAPAHHTVAKSAVQSFGYAQDRSPISNLRSPISFIFAGNYLLEDVLCLNNDDGTFADASRDAGLGEENRPGYPLSVGDFNGDGFLDVYSGNMAGQLNELWMNDGSAGLTTSGNDNHWLALRLVGRGVPDGSNVSAIGARVRVYAGGRWQVREIAPASPGNPVSLTAHFGLGTATVAETVEIRWPSGMVQMLENLAADRYHTIYEVAAEPTVTPTPTFTPSPTLSVTPSPSPTPTPTVPASACLTDANGNRYVDAADIMSAAQTGTCTTYVPLVANHWRQPWTELTPTASATSSPSPTATATMTPTLAPTPTAAPVRYVPGSSQKVCQITGEFDRERQQLTINRTESRFGVVGTDLGASFEHAGHLYFLFGDTVGVEGRGGDSIAYSDDTDPEDCVTLSFVTGRDGLYKPPHVPGISLGALEVPTGGFSAGGQMYVFFTTDHSEQTMMGRSILARSTDGAQSFEYLYDVSRDKFINIAPVVVDNADVPGLPQGEGQGLLLWGSGTYRQSDPYLAYMPLNAVEQRDALRYFAGLDPGSGSPRWSANESEAVSLFAHPCIGELSVAWNPFLGRWLMLYNCGDPRGINFRVADQPWGPWSEAQVLFQPWEDGGYCHFMHVSWELQNCDSVHDPGRQNVWGGEYGPYQIPSYAVGDEASTTIYYVMSTWNPYNVVLMQSTLALAPASEE